MSIAKDIIYISIFFWAFPPFRQFKGEFFLFFLILALSDPISLLLVKLTKINPDFIMILSSFLLFYSINFNLNDIKKKIYCHFAFIVILLILFGVIQTPPIIIMLIHLFILSKLVSLLIIKIFKENSFNIFVLMIVFYEISIVLNLSIYLTKNDIWLVVYYSTLTFQIFLAIFFTVFTEKSKRLILKLKPTE
jgi:hypothetical protein